MSSFLYCLNTSTIQPTPLLEKIRLAGKHGFQAVELWLSDVEQYVAEEGRLTDITAALADNGLIVPCTIALKGWVDADEQDYAATLDTCRRRFALAAQLGARFLVATPSRPAAEITLITQRYRDLLRIGRSMGVRPAMEFLGFSQSVFTVGQAWKVVVDCGEPDATLVLDSFHLYRGGSDLSDCEPIPAERIANYHINDAPAYPPRLEQADSDRVMPGEGILDLESQISLLRRKDYRGPVSLELFNRELWRRDPNQVVQLGMERMQALLQ